MNKRNFKFLSLLLVLFLMVGVFVGCSTQGEEKPEDLDKAEDVEDDQDQEEGLYPLTIEDAFGNEVTFEKAPEKIVSLVPSHTEIIYELGIEDKLVGIDANSNYPEQVAEKEIVGDYFGTDLEKIIELETDLVLLYGSGNEDDNARLKEAGVAVLGFLPESIEEVIETIEIFGQITDSQDQAKKVIDGMEDKMNSIIAKVEDAEKVKVFYEIWHDPLQAAGPGSFMDELIVLAGGENIAHDAVAAYAEYDLEQLIERDPQVYLTSEMAEPIEGMEEINAESISQRPGYENISAIKEGRVFLLDGDMLSRPGPRIVDALELVAKAIHPDLF